MSYTFMSDTAKNARAYDLGYKNGFNQASPDASAYEPGSTLWDTYYRGRLDGFNDYRASRTRTGSL